MHKYENTSNLYSSSCTSRIFNFSKKKNEKEKEKRVGNIDKRKWR